MMRTVLRLALGLGILAAATSTVALAGADQRARSDIHAVVRDGETSLAPTAMLDSRPDHAPERGLRTAVLPPDATSWTVIETGADGVDRPVESRLLGHMRGLPVVIWEPATSGAPATVRHDGSWAMPSPRHARYRSAGFDAAMAAAVPGLPDAAAKSGGAPGVGSYVIVTAPDYVAAAMPLVEWKTEKGFETVIVTTDETGTTKEAIQAWLRDAYDTWEAPPEYVLLLGDVDEIPVWRFSENVTDLPYSLMDDDWLPDLMLGRLPVSDVAAVENVVAKTVNYEKNPYRGDEGWFGRQLMVAGNFGSLTPTHTVRWVGEQMAELGFEPAAEVFHPPFFNGVPLITNYLEQGVGLCVYRGWAYGTAGWEPPHFTNDDIPGVDNGAMTPVLMSFVCLNGDFSGEDDCFGEAFLNVGTAAEPQGAVAFIGNGEHWSHTRYNDAMAISFFEAVPGGGRDLGGLLNAGKMRFMEYFPHEIDAATYGEESVEFYFHIYNLLGDPELTMWVGAPTEMVVGHLSSLPEHSRRMGVRAMEADGITALPGARMAAVADGELLDCAFADDEGVAYLDLAGWDGEDDVTLTVTHPDRFAYQAVVPAGSADVFLRVESLTWEDVGGNGDATVNPGETMNIWPVLHNAGTSDAVDIQVVYGAQGPFDVGVNSVDLASLPAGSTWDSYGAPVMNGSVPADAVDGDRITLLFTAEDAADTYDSLIRWTVAAPTLAPVAVVPAGDGVLDPGETAGFEVVLDNGGSLGTSGGQVVATLLNPEIGSLTTANGVFGAVDAGATVPVTGLAAAVNADVPVGANLRLSLAITTDEGYQSTVTTTVPVGVVDPGAPVGPDARGYWALDSADLDYPALVPEYRWTELDTALGGMGVEIPFQADNQVVLWDLPESFDFVYFGETIEGEIRVTENGWISFDTSSEYEFYNWPLHGPHGNHSVIAPFWDNFDPDLDGTGGVFVHHDETAGTLTFEWSRMRHYRPDIPGHQTFQLVLRDATMHPTPTGDGEMLFLYRQIDNNDHARQYATVGWEDADESDGLQLSYASVDAPGMAPLGPGLAVLATTKTPVRVPYELAAKSAVRNGASVTVSWEVDDPRPVVGWRVLRLADGGAEAVGGAVSGLLTASARTFTDTDAPTVDGLAYQIEAVHPYGHRNNAGVATVDGAAGIVSTSFALYPPRPNPAPGGTDLAFALPRSGSASLKVYDVAGRLVRTLHDGIAPEGDTLRFWDGRFDDGRDAAAGVYFARLVHEGRMLTRKVLLVR